VANSNCVYRLTYAVVTPLFLGDALRDARRFSLQSFKGALRFWWRALAWPRCWEQAGENERKALQQLHEREARLFGAAGEAGRGHGQSRVRLALDGIHLGARLERGQQLDLGPGARYLGYGLVQPFGRQAGALLRSGFREGGYVRICVAFRGVAEDERGEVLNALKLLGLLGGLGARVRRGWGSLSLRRIEGADWKPPHNAQSYIEAIRHIVDRPKAPRPPFSAFSAETRIDLLVTRKHPLQALDAMGVAMVRHRAWGHKGKILDGKEDSLRLFQDDHDWFKDLVSGKQRHDAPRRSAFGLPHNYYDSNTKRTAGVTTTGAEGAGDRRASPLFLHVHDLGEAGVLGVATRFLARFTSDDQVRVHLGKKYYDAPMREDWPEVLAGLIEGSYTRSGQSRAFFPERRRILPVES